MNRYFKTSHVIVYHSTCFWVKCNRIFQNISCYCLSLWTECRYKCNDCISKHLMLLFISNTNACFLSIYTYFKTSHVIVYHVSSHCSPGLVRISKHLMLLFIFAHVLTSFLIQIISKHLMLLFIGIFRPVPGDPEEFQNISCYCLSIQGITLTGMFFEFQNISCYCLS